MVKYSIIIPIHNNGQTIARTMQSVLAQTKQFDEIILVENGSSDHSRAFVQMYAHEDARVKVIIMEQGGVSRARNAGIRAANGDYLFFLDGDDTIHPDLLATLDAQIQQLSVNDARIDLFEVNFNHYFSTTTYATNPFILPHGQYTGTAYIEETLKSFQDESKFMVWRFLYRTDFFTAKHRFFDPSLQLFEDIAFMHKYLTKDVTIYVMGRTPLVDYLFHAESLTRGQSRDFAGAMQALEAQIEQPTRRQRYYLLAFASKVLTQAQFIRFARNNAHYGVSRAYVAYQRLTFERFLRRIKRRWKQSYD
jgi:glycosyltransferase involved in cell wall biosynthesis